MRVARQSYRIQEKDLPHRTREARGQNVANLTTLCFLIQLMHRTREAGSQHVAQGGAQPQPWGCRPARTAARATGGSGWSVAHGVGWHQFRIASPGLTPLGYMLSPAAQAAFGKPFS